MTSSRCVSVALLAHRCTRAPSEMSGRVRREIEDKTICVMCYTDARNVILGNIMIEATFNKINGINICRMSGWKQGLLTTPLSAGFSLALSL